MTTVLYDIGPYRSQIREFHGELLKTLERGDLAISRIFEILPVQVVTPDGQKRLEARGDGYLRRSEGVFVNASSEAQDIEFMDDALGKITVLFPASVKVQISLSGGGIDPHRRQHRYRGSDRREAGGGIKRVLHHQRYVATRVFV